jgi:hypothetical protein
MEIIKLQGQLIGETEKSWKACYLCNEPADSVAQSIMPVINKRVMTALCKIHRLIIEQKQNEQVDKLKK